MRIFRPQYMSSFLILAIGLATFLPSRTLSEENRTSIYVEAISAPHGFVDQLEDSIREYPNYSIDGVGLKTTMTCFQVIFLDDTNNLDALPKQFRQKYRVISQRYFAPSFFSTNVRDEDVTRNLYIVAKDLFRKKLNGHTSDISDDMMACVSAIRFWESVFDAQREFSAAVNRCR